MKKTHLIAAIGTLALVANLLLPGLVFAQESQSGSVTINCPASHNIDFASGGVPEGFSFTGVTLDYADTNPESSVQSNITAAALPATTVLEITGRTIEGCESTDKSWDVSLTAEDLDNGATGTISATDVYVITSNNYVGADTYCDNWGTIAQDDLCYVNFTTGPSQDVTTATQAYDVAQGSTSSADYSTNGSALDNSTPVEIIGWDDPDGTIDGLNGEASVGVAFAIHNGIDWNQEAGSYTGDITYTLTVS